MINLLKISDRYVVSFDMQKSIQFYASKRLSGGNKAMILSLFISYYQLQILSLKKLSRTAFYDVLQAKCVFRSNLPPIPTKLPLIPI